MRQANKGVNGTLVSLRYISGFYFNLLTMWHKHHKEQDCQTQITEVPELCMAHMSCQGVELMTISLVRLQVRLSQH